MFDTVLIANRGEIACRIARTCHRLGVRSVAVYSEADAGAAHVAACDEAWPIGPAAARESYLNAERILDVARCSGAQAIHPGYGFLSENAAFARACAAAGIAFIGPPAEAIEAMGSKSAARHLMAEAGVPLVPGYDGDAQDDATLKKAADDIGYPVLIKPTAGGGGKGMRRVDRAADFADALAAAKREAAASFGDDTVLLERYVTSPRHIEIQVFADTHGDAVHLFERDCSIQRRHQKLIEEAPAPGMTAERRAEMGAAAVRAAQAIGYVGAGTVEFIADAGGEFFFMEMNTRLQVEHPVTEMVTGTDLVAWQLQVAAGQPLPHAQPDLAVHGHAIEARVYAEDPAAGFLPSIGTITHMATPAETPHVRLDSGVRQGDAITVHYDPMIAKLIVWDHSRDAALRRLRRALGEFRVVGPTTNLRFLQAVAAHPAFANGEVTTHFIDEHRDALLPEAAPASDRVLAVASLAVFRRIEADAADRAARSGDPFSPWHAVDGFMLNDDGHHELTFRDGERDVSVTAWLRRDGYVLELPGGPVLASADAGENGELRVALDGVRLSATVVEEGERLTVLTEEVNHTLVLHDPLTAGMADAIKEGSLTAPMPGTVTQVHVRPGEAVHEGQALMILEAMKMEHTITATKDGVVDAVHYAAGDTVGEGAELLALRDAEDTERAAE
ncbi:3-methylcrotonoyl-CoA carboxylase, alpha subunit [Limimonas halophila]|uniref:3-methylcrotonoyl-CoA carboxylase, alpha subunit n=1 Tax=Limimonas halophila TaxID=1082479 RepID=A0A1G7QHL6_9PROT|nr:acetyl-CoA carboxylase biotin carboxylase subunit [Limimonas halophila]SDF97955.1 3-methylcrotonoyl-CoA carboxylase, alpha subunit [Limimonas halophila]